MTIVSDILKGAGVRQSVVNAAAAAEKKRKEDEEKNIRLRQAAQFLPASAQKALKPDTTPSPVIQRKGGLSQLPTAAKDQINKAVTMFSQGKKFDQQQADLVSRVLEQTSRPSRVIKTLTPEDRAAGQVKIESQQAQEAMDRGFFQTFEPAGAERFAPPVGVQLPGVEQLGGLFNRPKDQFDIFNRQPIRLVNAITRGTSTALGEDVDKVSETERAKLTGETEFLPKGSIEEASVFSLFKKGFGEALGERPKPASQDEEVVEAIEFLTPTLLQLPLLFPELISTSSKILTKLGDVAIDAIKFKTTTISGSELKKAISQLRSGNIFGASDEALDVAQEFINLNNEGVDIIRFVENGATLKVKREFPAFIRRWLRLQKKPSPVATKFLKDAEKIDFTTAPDTVVNSFFNRSLDILRPQERVFKPRVTSLKVAENAVKVGEQRVVTFAKVPRSERPQKPIVKPTSLVKQDQVIQKEVENVTFKDPVTGNTIKRNSVINKMAERLLKSDKINDEEKIFVRDNPSSYHERLTDKSVQEGLKGATREELREMFNQDNTKAASFAGLKLVKALEKEGRFDEAFEIFKLQEAKSVIGGQVVQAQKRWAEWLGPEHKIVRIEKDLDNLRSAAQKAGNKIPRELSREQKKILRAQFVEFEKISDSLNASQEKAAGSLDKIDIKNMKKIQKEYNKQLRKMSLMVSDMLPPTLSDVLVSTMKGNLLSIGSQVNNVVYNVTFTPVEIASENLAVTMDLIYSKLTGKERKLFRGSIIEYTRGLGMGFEEALNTVVRGSLPGDPTKLDAYRGMHPLRAMIAALSGKNLPVNPKTGKALLGDRGVKLVEGLLGIPPEAMFRFLALGDKPFFQAAYRSSIVKVGKKRGLSRLDIKRLLLSPDEEAIEIATKVALRSVFQQESKLSKSLDKGLRWLSKQPGWGGAARFLVEAQAPFRKTPINLVSSAIDYLVPKVSMTKAIYQSMILKDREAAFRSLARSIIGSMLGLSATFLIKNKLYRGDSYIGKKDRQAVWEGLKPKHVNITGYKRLIAGGDPSWQAGDTQVDLSKFSLFGPRLEMEYEKEIFKEKTKDQEAELAKGLDAQITSSVRDVLRIGNFILDQTMLSGTASFLDVISKSGTPQGDTLANRWFTSTWQAVTASVFPNTGVQFIRSQDEFLRERGAEGVLGTGAAVIREKLLGGGDLPIKIGMFGERILRTPEGRNPVVYSMISSFRFSQIAGDPKYKYMDEIFNETQDQAVFPSDVSGTFKRLDKNIELDPFKLQELKEEVGGERGDLLDQFLDSGLPDKLPNNQQIKLLKKIYSDGDKQGKELFFNEEVSVSTIVREWQIADIAPNMTRSAYGTTLNSLGRKINKSGDAPANDWRLYQERLFVLGGGDPDRIINEDNQLTVKNMAKKLKKIKISEAKKLQVIAAAVKGGVIDKQEFTYMVSQFEKL